jgi:two-component system chemotaxis response regulator CheY
MSELSEDDLPPLPADEWDDDSASVTPDQLKVLVVDDDALMRRLLTRALTNLGFTQIDCAENGAEGLAAVDGKTPAIIISDYHMPEMHGLQLIEALRANDALDQTVIIMLSAADDQRVIESARDCGADTFLVKPFEQADLKHLIDTLYHRFNCARIAWPD